MTGEQHREAFEHGREHAVRFSLSCGVNLDTALHLAKDARVRPWERLRDRALLKARLQGVTAQDLSVQTGSTATAMRPRLFRARTGALSIRTAVNIQQSRTTFGAHPGGNHPDMVPASSVLPIRANQISTREIAQDVLNQNGHVLVPNGLTAKLAVTVSPEGLLGARTVSLALRHISTMSEEQRGQDDLGACRRTAEAVRGGEPAAQVLTPGNEVRIQAETVSTLRLEQPIHARK